MRRMLSQLESGLPQVATNPSARIAANALPLAWTCWTPLSRSCFERPQVIPSREARIESLGLVFPETISGYMLAKTWWRIAANAPLCAIAAIGCMNLLDTLELILDFCHQWWICIGPSPSCCQVISVCSQNPKSPTSEGLLKHVEANMSHFERLAKLTENWSNWWEMSQMYRFLDLIVRLASICWTSWVHMLNPPPCVPWFLLVG